MIIRPAEYLGADGMPSETMLRSVISEHEKNIPRLKRLKKYYDGDNRINRKTRLAGQPCNKMAHPIARYIATVTSGYLLGKPVTYETTAESPTLEEIQNIYKRCAIPSVDSELARTAAIYGRGIEYLHVDENVMPITTALPPENAFVVYDDTYDIRPLFGVYYTPKITETGNKSGTNIWVAGTRYIQKYVAGASASTDYTKEERVEHYFGGVPLIEYWNDENERGDFEWIIPLIDAYDKLESDRIDDKDQFVDRLMVLVGCTIETDEKGREPWRQLREDKAIQIPDKDCDVKYIYEAMDENGNEVVRNAILEDIHKLSMVPDITDKNFASNASGVAMKYKLWGLEQLISIKQSWFSEGLRTRLRMYANFMQLRGFSALDVDDVRISFTRSMPTNELERSQIIQNASNAGAMSTEEKVKALHDGEEWNSDDIETEVVRIASEKRQTYSDAMVGNMLFGDTSLQEDEQDAQDGE